MTEKIQHFIDLDSFSKKDFRSLLDSCHERKNSKVRHAQAEVDSDACAKDKILAMIFEKPSTRTRFSFETAMLQLGGKVITVGANDMQLNRGETISDTAKVLSRYLDGLIIRTHGHNLIQEFSNHAEIPIVNALTDFLHPCQIYSDCMTLLENFGSSQNPLTDLAGKKLAFFGDTSCNMANSWILAGALWGLDIWLCGPEEFKPGKDIQNYCDFHDLPKNWHFTTDCIEAAQNADVIYTDVWVSMGCEEEKNERMNKMSSFQINNLLF